MPFTALLPAIRQIKAIAAAEGGSMSGVTRRGVRLRAVDRRIPGKADDVVVWRVQGVPVGPWTWRNTGTAAHGIRRRKRGNKRKLIVQHPGSGGSRRWETVNTRAEQIIDATFTRALSDVLARW